MYNIECLRNDVVHRQIICGYTCMDHDRIMVLENQPELSIGDRIIYKRVGAYTMTFGGMFIRYYPEVYVHAENCFERVRKPIDSYEYYSIHTL